MKKTIKKDKKIIEFKKLTSVLEHKNAIILSTSEIDYISRLAIIYYIETLLEYLHDKRLKKIDYKYLHKELNEQIVILRSTLKGAV